MPDGIPIFFSSRKPPSRAARTAANRAADPSFRRRSKQESTPRRLFFSAGIAAVPRTYDLVLIRVFTSRARVGFKEPARETSRGDEFRCGSQAFDAMRASRCPPDLTFARGIFSSDLLRISREETKLLLETMMNARALVNANGLPSLSRCFVSINGDTFP
jgi:hypothetical protein